MRMLRRSLVLLSAIAAVVLAACAPARADEGATPEPHVRSQRDWYGWQTLAADGVSLVLIPLVGSRTGNAQGTTLFAAGTFTLTAPLIHFAHGRRGSGVLSLALRLALPLGGSLLGGGLLPEDCRSPSCVPVGTLVGLSVGAVMASAIDAAALSYAPVYEAGATHEARRAPPPPPPTGIHFRPTFGPRKEGGFNVGVGTTF